MERNQKVILLFTDWWKGYWTSARKAPYPKTDYSALQEWDELNKDCPLPGIGMYHKFKKHDLRKCFFVYIEIKGMEYDPESSKPTFSFELISESKTQSIDLRNKLPPKHKRLFSAINSGKLLDILKSLNESPPPKWMELIGEGPVEVSWRDYIGKYFHEIDEEDLSNNEFEDRIFQLLKALGFVVTQKGHKIPGEFPDGVALLNDHAIVYDCKNMSEYAVNAEDKRAIEKYKEDEQLQYRDKRVYAAFIAKSFKYQCSNKIRCFSTNSLKYLLYKKLILGHKFYLTPFFKILKNNKPLTIDEIDKEWRG